MNIFEQLLSFGDAARLWKIDDSTLRKAVAQGRLIMGEDVQKFGKQWIITKSAMIKHFGELPK